jgi:hypothetical protein
MTADSIFKRYFYVLLFFTAWNVLLVLLHKYTHQTFDLLYLSYMTLMIGLYLSFVNPKRFVFRFGDRKYNFQGAQKFLVVDLVFHILVFLFVYYMYFDYYHNKDCDGALLNSVALIVLYVCAINTQKVYGITFLEFIIVFSATNLLYFILF